MNEVLHPQLWAGKGVLAHRAGELQKQKQSGAKGVWDMDGEWGWSGCAGEHSCPWRGGRRQIPPVLNVTAKASYCMPQAEGSHSEL